MTQKEILKRLKNILIYGDTSFTTYKSLLDRYTETLQSIDNLINEIKEGKK